MDFPIWGTDDISDEELLREFEAVKTHVPFPYPFRGRNQTNSREFGNRFKKKVDMEVEKEDV